MYKQLNKKPHELISFLSEFLQIEALNE